MLHSYRQLLGMIHRLVTEGMDLDKAVHLVARTYAVDAKQLGEVIVNQGIRKGNGDRRSKS